MEKAFPDMPINAGVEKALAVTTAGISSSAHTLLSLSFLIIPVSLAVAIKMFHWLGPFAAVGAVLMPVASLLYAEACLGEQGTLPLPGGALYHSKAGKPVRCAILSLRSPPVSRALRSTCLPQAASLPKSTKT